MPWADDPAPWLAGPSSLLTPPQSAEWRHQPRQFEQVIKNADWDLFKDIKASNLEKTIEKPTENVVYLDFKAKESSIKIKNDNKSPIVKKETLSERKSNMSITSSKKINDWYYWSLINIFFAFLIFGIIPLIYSSKSRVYLQSGKYKQAERYSKIALYSNIFGSVSAFLVYVACILIAYLWP